MTGLEIVMGGFACSLLILLSFLLFVILPRTRAEADSVSVSRHYSASLSKSGQVLNIHFRDGRGNEEVYHLISGKLVGWHMFALGVLAGTCLTSFAVRLALPSPAPLDSTLWMSCWLIVVALVWGVVSMAERSYVAQLRTRGVFDQLLTDGKDPLTVAGALHFSARRFRVLQVITAFSGAGVLALADGFLIPVLMLLVACLVWYFTWKKRSSWVTPHDLEHSLLSSGEHIINGGWITPIGVLLFAASLGLLHFWRAEISLLMYAAIAGIVLVLWSERVSRSGNNPGTLPELQEYFRHRLCGSPARQQANIETVS